MAVPLFAEQWAYLTAQMSCTPSEVAARTTRPLITWALSLRKHREGPKQSRVEKMTSLASVRRKLDTEARALAIPAALPAGMGIKNLQRT